MDQPRVIFHIDMDAFFAAIEQRDDPRLVGKPVVVGSDPKGGTGRGVVSTCSYEARKFGIHSAMPISQAYRACPHAAFLPVAMEKYSAVSAQIFSILETFTPDIEAISIDEAFLDMTGTQTLFGPPVEAARLMKARIYDQLGLNASVGIAPNKMVAKIASDYCKPDGLLEITPDRVQAFLWPLPVKRMWGIGGQTEKALAAIGVRTIGDLAALSDDRARKELGERGEDLVRLARGIDTRDVVQSDEVKSVSNEHTFDRDVDDIDAIVRMFSFLSEKVSSRLRQQDLKGKTITLKLRLSDFYTLTRAETIAERTNHFEPIFSTIQKLFADAYAPRTKVRLVGVKVSHFDDPYVQDSLFADARTVRTERVHKAVDAIKEKFGDDAIRRGR